MTRYGKWEGTPRETIPWHPVVDFKKCAGCKACFDFCGHGGYAWNEQTDRPVVAEPFRCVVGCSSCRNQCASEAISSPPLSVLRPFLKADHASN